MLAYLDRLLKEIRHEPWAKGIPVEENFWELLDEWIEQYAFSDFLGQLAHKIDEIVDIDPELSEPQILERATKYMVSFLNAHSASIRIYDPQTEQMLSYGSYPSEEKIRETVIPLEGSIAGEVVKTRTPCLVPNIIDEKHYLNKNVIHRKAVHSLMAIPFEIPRFFPGERDTVGVIQIYYEEKNRTFTSLEIQVSDIMARRLSFAIARKKILSLYRTNEKKEKIVQHIFKALGARGGIKMKEVFNRVIPELADIVQLQSCALFSVTEDYKNVILEAGYPDIEGYHNIGMAFPIRNEPAFEVLLTLREYSGTSAYEIVTSSYLHVVAPQRSELISENLKRFSSLHNINSILYIPLNVSGETSHFLTFEALDQRKRYRDDEINIFLFLGRELMKAQKMERLDDALHDFKNPAIATAGFARRLKKLLEKDESELPMEQIRNYVDILLEETSRLQELALSIYQVGKKHILNLTEILKRRFSVNKEAIKEQLKQNITLKEGPFDFGVKVCCYSMHLERVFDNLLNNATKAIPSKGGELAISTYACGQWACAEISNTGAICEEDRLRLMEGEGQEGRGLYITYRIIRLLKGKIEIQTEDNMTTFVVRIPLYKDNKKSSINPAIK